jgi:GT2 family glycosyltransferase
VSGNAGPAAAAPPGRAGFADRLRAELGPPPELSQWPPVSIVVVNRDGREHLELLLPRLAHATDYPALELVLVDNGSSDGSVEFVRTASLPFPTTIVESDANLSFADANDDGADRARFDRLLFLNNDVEPFEPAWLKELVACLDRQDAAAVGATLLHGARYRDRAGSGHVLQHRGVEFVREAGFVVPANSGDGEDLQSFQAADLVRPSCTAACLLVRRDAFEAVGGFTTGFLWGWEDVDLGFKLTAAGDRVVCSGRGILFHHESSTRRLEGEAWSRRTRAHNQRLFMERWGPQARREYLLDRFAGSGCWADHQPIRLAVALSGEADRDQTARELADAVEREGWRVTSIAPDGDRWERLPSDVDFVVVTDPGFGAAIPRGVDCVAWVGEPIGEWLASPWLRRAELVLAGHPGVEEALERAGFGALPFPGAASPERPGEISATASRELDCLVAAEREDFAPEWALALARCSGLRAAAVGPGWADGSHGFGVAGVADPPDRRRSSLYASAHLIVHSSPPDGSAGPADASALFDSLLAGALPLSDDSALVEGLLGAAAIPTWSSAEELEQLVGNLLGDDGRLRELVERGAALVRAEHTWPHRARLLIDELRGRSERRRFCLRLVQPWGADPLAAALKRSLERRGHACLVELRDEWESLDGLTADVAVLLGDPGDHCTKPAQLNVLCAADPTPSATQCDQWDLVLVQDAKTAERLSSQTPTRVAAIDLAAAFDPAAELLSRIESVGHEQGLRLRVAAHA